MVSSPSIVETSIIVHIMAPNSEQGCSVRYIIISCQVPETVTAYDDIDRLGLGCVFFARLSCGGAVLT